FMSHNLADYHVPVNADVHAIDVIFVEEKDDEINPLGVKGVGEIGIVGIAAAVANAVYHATGKRVRDLPITLDKLMRDQGSARDLRGQLRSAFARRASVSAQLTPRQTRPYKRICAQNQATIWRGALTPVRTPRSAIAWRCAKRAGTSRNSTINRWRRAGCAPPSFRS